MISVINLTLNGICVKKRAVRVGEICVKINFFENSLAFFAYKSDNKKKTKGKDDIFGSDT